MSALLSPPGLHDGSLLLHCLGIGNGPVEHPSLELTESGWSEILRQAGENGVTPLLYHRLTRIRPVPAVPLQVLNHLREAAIQSAALSLQIRRELVHVLEALRRHGIPVIVLKGGYLGQVVYESVALRTMCDLDVMVRREALERAAGVLGELGYVPQYYDVEEVDYAQHHHLRPMARPGGIRVEIHWSLARSSPSFEIDLEGVWERARRTDVAGVEALTLSPEDLVLHLCLHASCSHEFRVGLRTCWDILEVVRHHGDTLDWDQVVRRAREWRIGRYVYLMLRLARELLAADIPAAAIAALKPPGFPSEVIAWARTCMFSPATDVSVSPSMAKLWTAGTVNSKFSVLLATLCPSRAVMARIYGVSGDSRWMYAYYPMRWVDLLSRYGRHAWGLWRGHDRVQDDLRVVSEHAALRQWLRHGP